MAAWFQQIDEAQSIAAVVAAARDYLATWSPSEIARLPRPCRPHRMLRDGDDVEDLHGRAVDEYRTTRAIGDELTALQVYTGFLVRACLRIAHLREVASPCEEGQGATGDDPPARNYRAG